MKNKAKKIISTLSVVCIIGMLSGCQGESQDTDSAGTSQETESTSEIQEAEASNEPGSEGDTGTYEDGSTPEYSGEKIRLMIDGDEVIIAMYDNAAADAFMERLPLEEISFSDLSGIEKPAERPDEPFSIEDVEPGYDPVTGEMVIYRPWGNFTIFYGDFRYSDELVPLGKVESGLEVVSGQTDDFIGTLEVLEESE